MTVLECVGGPLDGRKMPASEGGEWYQSIREGQRHYYRACFVPTPRGEVRFLHYVGPTKRDDLEPRIIPYRLIDETR
jgi:hypothetical protein